MVLLARMPSPPTEASIGKTSTAGTPLACARANASTVEAMPSNRPAVSASRRALGSSTACDLTSRPRLFHVALALATQLIAFARQAEDAIIIVPIHLPSAVPADPPAV